jgi:tricorn protease
MRLLSRLVPSVLFASLTAAPAAAQTMRGCCASPMSRRRRSPRLRRATSGSRPGGRPRDSRPPRGEESFPRFSPDGGTLAYSANYDGNTDVYTVPVQGGDPTRLTWHPMTDRVLDWHPDGTRVLFASSRESGRQRYNQFYLVSAKGGPAEKLPVPYGEFATFSPTASSSPTCRSRRRSAPGSGIAAAGRPTLDVRPGDQGLGQRHRQRRQRRTPDAARRHALLPVRSRRQPARQHLGRDKNGALRQVTQFADFDVHSGLGPQDIVFEAGGRLYLLNLATEKATEVAIQVVTDRTTLKPRNEPVADLIREAAPSPTGKRAVFGARGDVFTVPAEFGPVLNLTRTSGSAERYPRWSPDGKTLAYWSDRSGEYELVLRPADGTGTEKTVTTLGPGYRFHRSNGHTPGSRSWIRPRRCACSTWPAARSPSSIRCRSGWRTTASRTCRCGGRPTRAG